jgi:hypothetical protein
METVVGYMVGRVGDTECMDELERGVAVSQNLYMVELIGEVLGAREAPRQCSAFAGWGGRVTCRSSRRVSPPAPT